MNLKQINLRYRTIKRFQHIAAVFAKNGFDFLIYRAKLYKLPFLKIKKPAPSDRPPFPEKIVLTFEELGPVFIKFGQILSTRYDLLPPDYADALSKLQDKITPVDFKIMKPVIEEELKNSIDSVFKKIETEPIGSASICQVYRALLFSGEDVIVKVKRPDIDGIVETDIEIMKIIAGFMKNHMDDIGIEPLEVVTMFEKTLLQELTLKTEASSIQRFYNNFKENEKIIIPRVHWEYATKNLIVTSYIEGEKLTEFTPTDPSEPEKLARVSAAAVVKQIFSHGFFHADPHPGNILIVNREKIAFIDFGIIGRLSYYLRNALFDFTLSVLDKDMVKIFLIMEDLNAFSPSVNETELKNDIFYAVDEFVTLPLEQIEIEAVFNKTIGIIRKHKLKIPPDYLLLLKTLVIMDGVGKKFAPGYNLINDLKPELLKIVREKLKYKNIYRQAKSRLMNLAYIVKTIPYDIRKIIRKFNSGQMHIEFEHKNLDGLIGSINHSVNLLAMAILDGAVILSSSFILMISSVYNLKEFVILGVTGILIAAVLSVYLVIKIVKNY